MLVTGLVLATPAFPQDSTAPAGDAAATITPNTAPDSQKPWLFKGSDIPPYAAWHFGTLPNGVRYAVRRNGVPPGQVSIRVRIGVGSLMENPSQRGFAHLLEHLSFRGSAVAGDMESKRIWQRLGVTFGSDSNAETTFTQTVYKLDLPSATTASLDESMHILAGMMEQPDLDQKALDAERPAVLAERREQPGPQVKMANATRELYFAGQPLADRSPIGDVKALEAATPASVRAFHDKWYRPERAVVVVAGDLDPALLEQAITKYFGAWKGDGASPQTPDFGRPQKDEPRVATIAEPDFPPVVSMAYIRPWTVRNDTILFNQRRMIDMIAIRLVNRRLERKARSGGSFLQAGVDLDDVSRSANVTGISIVPAGKDWQAALKDVRAVIEDAKTSPPSQAEIDREVSEVLAGMKNSVATSTVEPGSSQADMMVQAVDIHETVASPQVSLAIFQQAIAKKFFTPANVLAASKKVFDGVALRAIVNTQHPDAKAPAQLLADLDANVSGLAGKRTALGKVSFDDLPKLGPAGKVTGRSVVLTNPEITKVAFANGVNLLMFPNASEKGKVYVRVRFGHGYNAIPADHVTPAWAGSIALVPSGVGTLNQEQLDQLTGDRQIGMDFGIDDDAFELSAATTAGDLDDQLRLLATKLADPGWDPNPVKRARAVALAAYDTLSSSPRGVLTRDLDGLLRDGDPRWATPSKAEVEKLTPQGFRDFWAPILASGPIEVQVFGDATADQIVSAVGKSFGALKPRPAEKTVDAPIRFPTHDTTPVVLHHNGKPDQAAALIAWPTGGGVAGIAQGRGLDVLAAIFQDRLFDQLRSQAGASYSPSVSSDWPEGLPTGGKIMAVGMVAPDKTDLFFRLSRKIAADLVATPVSDDELRRAVAPIGQYLMRASSGNPFWMEQSKGGSFDPARIAAIDTMPDDYMKLTPADVQALAKRYLVPSKDWTMVILPQSQAKAGK